jgi:hypothetical protein
MMTSIVSNDEPSMVEEDVESDKIDDLQILIGQTLALSRLPSNFGNIMNELRPSKKATTQLTIYFENESEEREDIFTKVIFHTTRNRTKVGNPPPRSNDGGSSESVAATGYFNIDHSKRKACNCLSKLVGTQMEGFLIQW